MTEALPDWPAFTDRLTSELSTLGNGGFVIVSEASPPQESVEADRSRGVRGLFRRAPARQGPPLRYVQVMREASGLIVECVGSASRPVTGSEWPMTPEQESGIEGLGFSAPRTRGEVNYRADLAVEEAGRAADAGAGALRILGLTPGDRIEWQRDG